MTIIPNSSASEQQLTSKVDHFFKEQRGLFLKNQVDPQNKTLNQTNPFPSIRLKLVLSKQDRAAALDVEPRTHVSRGQRGGHRYACGPHQIGQ